MGMNTGSYSEVLKNIDFAKMGKNPENYPNLRNFKLGTAHLLEHSVFLTETPEEKSQIIMFNAFTAALKTNYMVTVSPENIFNALVFKLK
jgi:tRNA U34 5-carboxymethylaminomethyl modifying enzyme MnmG/GidA